MVGGGRCWTQRRHGPKAGQRTEEEKASHESHLDREARKEDLFRERMCGNAEPKKKKNANEVDAQRK